MTNGIQAKLRQLDNRRRALEARIKTTVPASEQKYWRKDIAKIRLQCWNILRLARREAFV